ncbi:MAG: theronine dehydrogenase, partial [Ruminococcaceae bacterium]|nr:theronine dehydrogenase [Oscillospiraceae bacterium]
MNNRAIVFTDVNTAEIVDKGEIPVLQGNEVKVKTLFSTVSCGTEKANITAHPSLAPDKGENVVFPRQLGYSSSGIVEEVGENVKTVKPGDRVVMYWSTHSEYNILGEDKVIKIENETISMQEAAVAFITTFPMAAIRKTKLELGESVLIMGLGLLGQLAIKLARLAGAVPIVAVD